ncbi:MAG TPA: helix-turn-helix domain-containing protein [Candidatus Elarobacter sp.]|nr:helix-turn-helix domain-containing protein [Candidatus Elarobacter sp.]
MYAIPLGGGVRTPSASSTTDIARTGATSASFSKPTNRPSSQSSSSHTAETFAERLRRLREEKGFTLAALAAAVGVSPGAIQQLESGQVKNLGFGLGLRIADRLNVDPRYLAGGAGLSMTDHLDTIERRLDEIERLLNERQKRR